ncbi:UDP-glucose/GDP-mannose dehydrogenase family protein [Bacillus thuringiensis]|uniref:UDP-glucose 6-dehydrogenase n=1 Tax=Bacillus thuringiensis TaxID=1428 RepID=A0AAW9GUN6_BACTU|nr:UDP-glucose/GDP-mannose dehydrogenase family protein [Bacillus thuringiensis]MDY0855112.1 UDP-glucose/GDP-mannose dehydrogenase family protein [Bacillus thuringiensis]MDY4395341.1 UDP-glucose/GDP-mannose dehydrogenase family protein [Bacillus thuringiensis]
MKIAILGTGYVGLSTGVCLSEIGHSVICIDTDKQKIKNLNQGISPIYEPGLETLLTQNAAAGRLIFTTSHREALNGAEIIIIAVGTPQMADGRANLSYIEQAAKDIAANLIQSAVIVLKSTVPIGTNELIKKFMVDICNENVTLEMVSNPEFLRQGSAIMDTLKPDRIIIGSENEEAAKKVQKMYLPLNVPFLLTSIKSAEMIKYASNAYLATKISFINEISNLCEVIGADVKDVVKGMGKDKRIGEAFLQPGIGYGGSCFPKDVKALLHTANLHGIPFSLLKETVAINDFQQELLVTKAKNRLKDLKGKKITMLGLAFKPETDDMREAPSIKIAHSLVKLGAEVVAYDPAAIDNAKKILGDTIKFSTSVLEATVDADAIFIVTEWNEFKCIELEELIKVMRQPIVFDGRNCFEENQIRACKKIEYYPIGRPAIFI